ncbi:MAG: hypothetical protein RMY64_29010 [Nostoc sp. DedQUE08]|nr:hypothetical protein [Nostoc sp. DedQUE04]MDZ8069605.1 hypothetical protein [Nostoc sp. DedQUE08]
MVNDQGSFLYVIAHCLLQRLPMQFLTQLQCAIARFPGRALTLD